MAKNHLAGLLSAIIRGAIRVRNEKGAPHPVLIDQEQGNHIYGIQQCRIKFEDDPQIYRMIIAPADAPIKIGPMEIDQHFLAPISQAIFKGEPA